MFITFEGIEGAGKTTQVEAAAEFIKSRGVPCVLTREPGSTEIGSRIRSILLDPASRELDPVSELLLYMADRAQHVRTVVIPALQAGKTVLCDRYFDATLAYQGYARGLDIDLLESLHRLALGDLRPDLTFLLDLSPSAGLERAWRQVSSGGRPSDETRFENEDVLFHEKVRSGYLDLAKKEPGRFCIIDAADSPDQVQEDIQGVLNQCLKKTEKTKSAPKKRKAGKKK